MMNWSECAWLSDMNTKNMVLTEPTYLPRPPRLRGAMNMTCSVLRVPVELIEKLRQMR